MKRSRKPQEEDPPVGTRVEVWSADGQHCLGEGTYQGDVPLTEVTPTGVEFLTLPAVVVPQPVEVNDDLQELVEECMLIFAEDTVRVPKIILDSGNVVVFGCQCWWKPVEQ